MKDKKYSDHMFYLMKSLDNNSIYVTAPIISFSGEPFIIGHKTKNLTWQASANEIMIMFDIDFFESYIISEKLNKYIERK